MRTEMVVHVSNAQRFSNPLLSSKEILSRLDTRTGEQIHVYQGLLRKRKELLERLNYLEELAAIHGLSMASVDIAIEVQNLREKKAELDQEMAAANQAMSAKIVGIPPDLPAAVLVEAVKQDIYEIGSKQKQCLILQRNLSYLENLLALHSDSPDVSLHNQILITKQELQTLETEIGDIKEKLHRGFDIPPELLDRIVNPYSYDQELEELMPQLINKITGDYSSKQSDRKHHMRLEVERFSPMVEDLLLQLQQSAYPRGQVRGWKIIDGDGTVVQVELQFDNLGSPQIFLCSRFINKEGTRKANARLKAESLKNALASLFFETKKSANPFKRSPRLPDGWTRS